MIAVYGSAIVPEHCDADDPNEIWCAVLDAGSNTVLSVIGYEGLVQNVVGDLTPDGFTFDGTDYTVTAISQDPESTTGISGFPLIFGFDLTEAGTVFNSAEFALLIGEREYSFGDATLGGGTAGARFVFSETELFLAADSSYNVKLIRVNVPPTAADGTVTTPEDTDYTFTASDFSFSDTDTGDALASVRIVTLPASGTLTLSGAAVSADGVATKAQLDAGALKYAPPANANGTGYASFTFKVSDGEDESASAYTMTVDVTPVNDPATGAPVVAQTRNASYVGAVVRANRGTVDDADGLPDGTFPAGYTFEWERVDADGSNPVAISGATGRFYRLQTADVGKRVRVKLSFTDGGGTAEGPLTSAAYPAAGTVTALPPHCDADDPDEIWCAVLDAERDDSDSNTDIIGYRSAEGLGSVIPDRFTFGGTAYTVTALYDVNVGDGRPMAFGMNPSGEMVFNSAEFALVIGSGEYSFGDASFLDDIDQFVFSKTGSVFGEGNAANVKLIRVNVPPTAADGTVTTPEDTDYTFTASDFSFSDTDTGDALASVRIVTLPASGTLTLSGAAVSADGVATKAQLDAGALKYAPPANANGTGYASFTFKVSDGEDESASAYTMRIDVTPVNDPATGAPVVTHGRNASHVGVSLRADRGTVDDVDGRPPGIFPAGYGFQWERVDADGSNPAAISGATGRDYRLQTADVGKRVRVTLSFTDDGGTAEARTSAAYPAAGTVTALPPHCDAADPDEIWCAVLVSGVDGSVVGYHNVEGFGSLIPDRFTFGGTAYTVTALYNSGGSRVYFGMTPTGGTVFNSAKFALVIGSDEYSFGEAANGLFEFLNTGSVFTDGDAANVRLIHVNAAPTAADGTVTTPEDTDYTFTASDFSFSDTDTGDALASVRIVTLPASGTLTLSGAAVSADGVATKAQLDAGALKYAPPANANGTGYASFTFKVSDGEDESASAYTMTINVTPVNDPATGAPAISGTARVGNTLTAVTSGIADPDGLGAFTYQWKRFAADGSTFEADLGTGSTQTLGDAELGKRIKVEVRFTDGGGTAEGPLASDAFPSGGTVGAAANVPPTAADGTATTPEDTDYTFTASDFSFSDTDTGDALASVRIVTLPASGTLTLSGAAVSADGVATKAQLDAGALKYAPPANANGTGYASFTFKVSDGEDESASAYTMTINVTPVNDPATGAPAISGTARVGNTLTAVTSGIADPDGLGAFTYQWKRFAADGSTFEADLGTGSTQTLGDAELGKRIKVEVRFTDGGGTAEGPLASDAFPSGGTVGAAANVPPTAADGTATTPEDTDYTFTASDFSFSDTDTGDALASVRIVTLPASGTLTLSGAAVSADGVATKAQLDAGALKYAPPANANGTGYASFTFKVSDGEDESASAYTMTVDVTPVNDPATGRPAISGTALVGGTLRAVTSGIADPDGLGAFTYRWKRFAADGSTFEADLGTGSTQTLGDAELGKRIRVEVRFTDGGGTAEGPLTSDPFPSDGTVGTDDGRAPELIAATVDSASLVLGYHEHLDAASVPDPADFRVTADGSVVGVGGVDIDRGSVNLALSRTVQAGDTVKLDYTPGANPIRDLAGRRAPAISGRLVRNATLPPATDWQPPWLVRATVNASTLAMSYDEPLDAGSRPAPGDFAVTAAGAAVAVGRVVVGGSSVTLTLAGAVQAGQAVRLDYTPGANPIRDKAGNDAAALSGFRVTNITPDPGSPPRVFIAPELEGDVKVAENAGNAVLSVVLDRPAPAALSVIWSTQDGSATAPDDYTAHNGSSVTFAAGQDRRSISIRIVNDTVREDPDAWGFHEEFYVMAEGGHPGYVTGDGSFAGVQIIDDDGPSGGMAGDAADDDLALLNDLSPDAAAAALFGERSLGADRLTALDRLGNRNGRYDLGDLLAWIDRCRRGEADCGGSSGDAGGPAGAAALLAGAWGRGASG
ncbi:MAG: SwmB domain-containing protein, partial [Gemmatimonadota bacterium]|nr:SwmB domain-containing protein [Gemmatimonadota bacterium]